MLSRAELLERLAELGYDDEEVRADPSLSDEGPYSFWPDIPAWSPRQQET